MAQAVDCRLYKHEALSSNSNPTKKKKKKKKGSRGTLLKLATNWGTKWKAKSCVMFLGTSDTGQASGPGDQAPHPGATLAVLGWLSPGIPQVWSHT
jgi:hypothetical protein